MKTFYPLTYNQKNIWEIEYFISRTSINLINGILRFKDEFDIKILEKAINILVKKTIQYERALK